MNRRRALIGVTAALMLFGACGDGDDDDSSSATTRPAEAAGAKSVAPEHRDYCAHVAEINASDPPTVAQFKRYQELAPPTIKNDVAVAAPAFIKAIETGDPEKALADPKVRQAADAVKAFEVQTCGAEAAGE